jgi:hypothetical protein
MQNSAEKAREKADKEMRAQQEQAKKERLQATLSVRTASYIPRTTTRDRLAAPKANADTSTPSQGPPGQGSASPSGSTQTARSASFKSALSHVAQKSGSNSTATADVGRHTNGARRQHSRVQSGLGSTPPSAGAAPPGRLEDIEHNLDIKQPKGILHHENVANEHCGSLAGEKSHDRSDRSSGSRVHMSTDQPRVTRFLENAEFDLEAANGLARPETSPEKDPSDGCALHGNADESADTSSSRAKCTPDAPPPVLPAPLVVERPSTPALPNSVTGEISATSLATEPPHASGRSQTAAGISVQEQNNSGTQPRTGGIASYDPMMHNGYRSRSLSPASATPTSASDHDTSPADTSMHENWAGSRTIEGAVQEHAVDRPFPPFGYPDRPGRAERRPQTSPGPRKRSVQSSSAPESTGQILSQLPSRPDSAKVAATSQQHRVVKGLFKAKAMEIMKEKRLGAMKRFASNALKATLCRVEKCAQLLSLSAVFVQDNAQSLIQTAF